MNSSAPIQQRGRKRYTYKSAVFALDQNGSARLQPRADQTRAQISGPVDRAAKSNTFARRRTRGRGPSGERWTNRGGIAILTYSTRDYELAASARLTVPKNYGLTEASTVSISDYEFRQDFASDSYRYISSISRVRY